MTDLNSPKTGSSPEYTCILEKRGDLVLTWLLDGSGHSVEIHADREESGPVLGEIYACRVQKIRKDLEAAFVDLCPGRRAYLPLEEVKDAVFISKGAGADLQQGDELLVQVCREPLKTKDAAVTARLSLQGIYSVVSLQDGTVGVSRRLPEEDRIRLQALAARARTDESWGLILRTNAASASEEAVEQEILALRRKLLEISSRGAHRKAGTLLWGPGTAWCRRLLSLGTLSTRKIVADGQDLYLEAGHFLAEHGSALAEKVEFYSDTMVSCRALYSLDRELGQALGERVWLPGGGYLVIQPTEALTVIDVNSGRAVSRKDKEEAILRVNLEAAEEICRQLRLREISGIIIVDFINQENPASKDTILAALRAHLRRDPQPTSLAGFTALGLVEMTRRKTGPSLREVLKGETTQWENGER